MEDDFSEGPEDLVILRGDKGELEIRIPVQVVTKLGASLAKILGEFADQLDYAQLTFTICTDGAPGRTQFLELVEALRCVREGRNVGIAVAHDVIEGLLATGMSLDEFAAIMGRNFHQHEMN